MALYHTPGNIGTEQAANNYSTGMYTWYSYMTRGSQSCGVIHCLKTGVYVLKHVSIWDVYIYIPTSNVAMATRLGVFYIHFINYSFGIF